MGNVEDQGQPVGPVSTSAETPLDEVWEAYWASQVQWGNPGWDVLDNLPAEAALAAVGSLRSQLDRLELETIRRARVEGVSWRRIAAASGIAQATVRRWAKRR